MQMNGTYLCISFMTQYFDKTEVRFCIKDQNNYVAHYVSFLFHEIFFAAKFYVIKKCVLQALGILLNILKMEFNKKLLHINQTPENAVLQAICYLPALK